MKLTKLDTNPEFFSQAWPSHFLMRKNYTSLVVDLKIAEKICSLQRHYRYFLIYFVKLIDA